MAAFESDIALGRPVVTADERQAKARQFACP
jgi:hypothetical protein